MGDLGVTVPGIGIGLPTGSPNPVSEIARVASVINEEVEECDFGVIWDVSFTDWLTVEWAVKN